MQLNDFQKTKIKNTIRKFGKVLRFAFCGKSDLYIGFYALLTAQALINAGIRENCADEKKFKEVRVCLAKILSEFQKEVYSMRYESASEQRAQRRPVEGSREDPFNANEQESEDDNDRH